MSIFKRISDLVRSNVNDALDKAEDPRKVLEQTVLDMEADHKKARQKLLESITLTKQTQKQAEKYRKDAVEWEAKAMAALKAGSEDLARSALGEKQKSDELAAEAEAGVAAQSQSTDELKGQIKLLEEKIGEAKRKKDELLARLNATDMQKRQASMQGAGTGNAVGDTAAFDTYSRMVEKIENSEAEAEARRELLGARAPEVDDELKRLSAQQSADDALQALKAKMSSGGGATPSAPAAPAGEKASAIEDELAALKAKLGG